MNLGEALRNYRKKKDLTQTQLARILKVSPSIVSQWERNEKTPTHELVVDRLKEMLGEEIPEVRELRGGSVRLQEAIGGHRDLLDAWFWTGQELADKRSDRLSVEHRNKEVVFRLKVR